MGHSPTSTTPRLGIWYESDSIVGDDSERSDPDSFWSVFTPRLERDIKQRTADLQPVIVVNEA